MENKLVRTELAQELLPTVETKSLWTMKLWLLR